MLAPGFNHIIDGLIQVGLTTLDWFPDFLAQVKAILRICRDHGTDVCNDLTSMGYPAAGELIKGGSWPNFAHWRWGTMRDVCDAIGSVIHTLRQHLPTVPSLRRARDQSCIGLALRALASREFASHFNFVHWFTIELTDLMWWGSTCLCHEHIRGQPIPECDHKGRLITVAFDKCTRVFDAMIQYGNSLTVQQFGGDIQKLARAQGMINMVVGTGRRKTQFLDEIPYLLARLGEEGVKQRVLQQWNQVPPAGHHDIACFEFLGATSQLRPLIDALPDGACVLPPLLHEAVMSLRYIPFNDKIAEGPHAIAQKIGIRSRAMKWPWLAGTMRLDQNLKQLRNLSQASRSTLQRKWNTYSSVLQTDTRHVRRSRRLNKNQVCARVYTINLLHKLPSAPGDADDADDVDTRWMIWKVILAKATKHPGL